VKYSNAQAAESKRTSERSLRYDIREREGESGAEARNKLGGGGKRPTYEGAFNQMKLYK
jgi:hypothetical protein